MTLLEIDRQKYSITIAVNHIRYDIGNHSYLYSYIIYKTNLVSPRCDYTIFSKCKAIYRKTHDNKDFILYYKSIYYFNNDIYRFIIRDLRTIYSYIFNI